MKHSAIRWGLWAVTLAIVVAFASDSFAGTSLLSIGPEGLVMATVGIIQTKGTKLYFGYAPGASSSDPDGVVIHKVACPTGFTGLSSGEAARVDVTCLDSEAREYADGLQDLPSIQIPVNLIPRSEAHQALMAAEDEGSNLIMPWMLVLSDNTSAPTTLDSDGHLASPGPTNRYWKGYVSNFSEDYAIGEYVRATITVQLTTRIRRENPAADLA